MRRRAFFGAGVAVGVILHVAGANMAPQADDLPQPAPPPPPVEIRYEIRERVETRFVFSPECRLLVDKTDRTANAIIEFEAGIAPQQATMNEGLMALMDSNQDRMNEAITAQNSILNNTTGPLQRIMEVIPNLDDLRAACLDSMEE